GQLASHWRSRFQIPVVGVTGSNGKTTVKEMIASILRLHAGEEAVLATCGNLNNAIGVPLMLLRLRGVHRFAVIEMGMNHLGEIAYLARMTRPTVALITNAGVAHIGEVGSREAIAQAKGEIFEGLGKGIAVINADDRYASYWRGLNRGRRVIDFGFGEEATVHGRLHDGAMSVRTPNAHYDVTVPTLGEHNLRNALAACAVAYALEIASPAVVAGFARFENAKGRLQRLPGKNGSTLIDDTYNANPDSTKAAAKALSECHGTRMFVLGDMGELGEAASA